MFSTSQRQGEASPLNHPNRPHSARTNIDDVPPNQLQERQIKSHSLSRTSSNTYSSPQPVAKLKSNSLSRAQRPTNLSNNNNEFFAKHSPFPRTAAPTSSSPNQLRSEVTTQQPNSAHTSSQSSPSKFKSELFMSINRPDLSSKLVTSNWDDMHDHLERRRAEWGVEVNKIRRDRFLRHPISEQSIEANSGSSSPSTVASHDSVQFLRLRPDDASPHQRQFSVSFDVSQFLPEEVGVRTQNRKLLVHAKHEEMCTTPGGTAVNREFSRQIDIPRNVEADDLQCTLRRDGVLLVEADVRPELLNIRRRSSPGLASNTQLRKETSPSLRTTSTINPGPLVNEEDGVKKFRISVNVGVEFRPDELSIKTIDRKLIVLARHEESCPGRTSCKEFSRQFELPLVVDPTTVTANMTQDGILILEAPISSYTHGLYTGSPVSTESVTFSYDRS